MKKILLTAIALLLFVFNSFPQKFKTFKEHCGLYYKSMEDLYKQQAKELEFYHFLPGQTVASIGAQCCHWEAAYAATTDNIEFYLEDIDSTYFNRQQADFAWNYYATIRNRSMNPAYHLVFGDEKKTNLPSGLFDKILIINSFHEFSYQKGMLEDIAEKLKAGGLLYIDEALARKTGELHQACHKRMYLAEELITFLKKNGYELAGSVTLNYRKSKPVRAIFAFKKIE